MPDASAIPVRRAENTPRAKDTTKAGASDHGPLAAVSAAGPRKLIRPPMPAGMVNSRYPPRISAVTPVRNSQVSRKAGGAEKGDSHAETFYFQKQIHSQTLMIFVLDDGEQIEGHIEWYDRGAIKVRHGGLKTLIYKAAIKYLYKAADKIHI